MTKPTSVYFFGTCLIDLIFPLARLSAMRLLRREGIRVLYPRSQTCCGQPAYNSGFRDEARVVAAAQLDAFPDDIPVVVPSASCAGMFRVHYPVLFAGTSEEAPAGALANRVYELAEFLVRVLDLKPDDLGPPLQVVMHNSCSARRDLGVADAAMDLLGRLSNISAVEPDHAYECCGFGGTFAVKCSRSWRATAPRTAYRSTGPRPATRPTASSWTSCAGTTRGCSSRASPWCRRKWGSTPSWNGRESRRWRRTWVSSSFSSQGSAPSTSSPPPSTRIARTSPSCSRRDSRTFLTAKTPRSSPLPPAASCARSSAVPSLGCPASTSRWPRPGPCVSWRTRATGVCARLLPTCTSP